MRVREPVGGTSGTTSSSLTMAEKVRKIRWSESDRVNILWSLPQEVMQVGGVVTYV